MFEDYVSMLDAWEYDLLRHTTLLVDAFTISGALSTLFVAGSDGSEKYGTDGAFGRMISTNSDKPAATGMGPACGWQMDSYCAEYSRLLSLLRFITRLGKYTFRNKTWSGMSGMIGTDSQSILEKLFGRKRVSEGKPLDATMLVDLDVMVAE
jgi:hypothetical protein